MPAAHPDFTTTQAKKLFARTPLAGGSGAAKLAKLARKHCGAVSKFGPTALQLANSTAQAPAARPAKFEAFEGKANNDGGGAFRVKGNLLLS